ncbi:hypothetical protein GCM10011505_13450 [Tistrella bauzanensis]|uniref:Uncharacterized protein n=1 Tax=Tistrella bauzanensis TaxID=657419 RepID=A0ABQ1IC40_9PROT|nr:hypothetical protein GCM10011505_13450 [Tistrella bauzanensis]
MDRTQRFIDKDPAGGSPARVEWRKACRQAGHVLRHLENEPANKIRPPACSRRGPKSASGEEDRR